LFFLKQGKQSKTKSLAKTESLINTVGRYRPNYLAQERPVTGSYDHGDETSVSIKDPQEELFSVKVGG
jgi:hypothetical protein